MLTIAMRDLFTKFTTTEDSSGERFGTTGSYIHVGSSTATEVSSQNTVLGTSTADGRFKGMDAGYPKRNDGTDSTGVNILLTSHVRKRGKSVDQFPPFQQLHLTRVPGALPM